MSKLSHISDHPDYQPKLDPKGSDVEHQTYLRLLDKGVLGTPTSEKSNWAPMGELEVEPGLTKQLGSPRLSICTECLYRQDARNLWQQLQDWLLLRKPNPICTHGLVQYCQNKNRDGDCPGFKPTVYHW